LTSLNKQLIPNTSTFSLLFFMGVNALKHKMCHFGNLKLRRVLVKMSNPGTRNQKFTIFLQEMFSLLSNFMTANSTIICTNINNDW
jgi:hypothetical protein